MSHRPIVLIVCDYYLPGFESGGAVRTLANMVERLGDVFDFRVITRDHDGISVRARYETVKVGAWNNVGKAKVFYLSKDQIRARVLKDLIDESNPEVVYLNSFFARLTILFLVLVKFRRITHKPVILAPEGEFSPGALSLGPLKKKLYIANSKILLLRDSFLWKAASETEKCDIEKIVGNKVNIHVAPNMPPQMIFPDFDKAERGQKQSGSARMIFLSRFMRKKNFNWLLEHLRPIKGELVIDICGTLEEPDYWQECRRIIASLPSNIRIESKGPIRHELVSVTLAKYHFFILPTLGENFGHVFIEAFASALPVITSDRTPWRGLAAKGIGWDISLEKPSEWTRAIQQSVSMGSEEYEQMSSNARAFAVEWLSDPKIEQSNLDLLKTAVSQNQVST